MKSKAEFELKATIESKRAVGTEDYVKAASGSAAVCANVLRRLLLQRRLQRDIRV